MESYEVEVDGKVYPGAASPTVTHHRPLIALLSESDRKPERAFYQQIQNPRGEIRDVGEE